MGDRLIIITGRCTTLPSRGLKRKTYIYIYIIRGCRRQRFAIRAVMAERAETLLPVLRARLDVPCESAHPSAGRSAASRRERLLESRIGCRRNGRAIGTAPLSVTAVSPSIAPAARPLHLLRASSYAPAALRAAMQRPQRAEPINRRTGRQCFLRTRSVVGNWRMSFRPSISISLRSYLIRIISVVCSSRVLFSCKRVEC